MVKKKNAARSPDTEPPGGERVPRDDPDGVRYICAENAESIDSHSTGNVFGVHQQPGPRIHPAIFEVMKDGNILRFLSNLIVHLQGVDNTTSLLPTPEASTVEPFTRTAQIPKDVEEAKVFVKNYVAGLTVTKKGTMKGKVWIQSHAKFVTIKKNKKFLTWLAGTKTSPRVNLDRMDMDGTSRFSAGFFINVVARYDLTSNFAERVASMLLQTRHTGPTPEFQIEAASIYARGSSTRVYRAITTSTKNVEILNSRLALLMPKPTTGISYVPYSVWELLEKSKKLEYFDMQSTFASHHNALRMNGINDARLPLARTSTSPRAKVLTIFEWLSTLKAADGCLLFCEVAPCLNGEIELWHHVTHTNEAKAWLATALPVIAQLSGIHLDTDRPSADDMFKNPDKVWKSLEKMNRGVSITAQRSFFMDFRPPCPTAAITTPTGKRGGQARYVPTQVKLVFDVDDDTVVSLLSTDEAHSRSSSRRSGKRQGRQSAGRSVASPQAAQSNNQETAAKLEAAKAIAIAQAAIKKYPPTFKTAHQGDYYSLPDCFGNPRPVVFLDGRAVPLTEATLLESRKQVTGANVRTGGYHTSPPQATLKPPPAPQPTLTISPSASTPSWGDDDSDDSDDDDEVKGTANQSSTATGTSLYLDDQEDQSTESIVTTDSDAKSTGGISWAEVVASSSNHAAPLPLTAGQRFFQTYSKFTSQPGQQPSPVIKPPTASKYGTKSPSGAQQTSPTERSERAKARLERNTEVAILANQIVELRNNQEAARAAHAAELLALQQKHQEETAQHQAENRHLSSLLEDFQAWMDENSRSARASNITPLPLQPKAETIDTLMDDASASSDIDDCSTLIVWSPPKKRTSKRSTLQAALQSSPTVTTMPRTKKRSKALPSSNRFASLEEILPDADEYTDEETDDFSESHSASSLEKAVAATAGKIQALTILKKKSSPGAGSNGAGRRS